MSQLRNTMRSRRNLLKVTGTGLAVGLAGCLGDDDDPTDDDDTDDGDDDGDEEVDEYADFPEETVTWINPSGPEGGFGGAAYALEPVIGQHLPNPDGTVVVESFGDWTEGTLSIHNADPDGYTIGWANVPGMIVDDIIGGLEYDYTEWTWFGVVQRGTYALYVPYDSPIEDIDDYLDLDSPNVAQNGGTGNLVNLLLHGTLHDEFDPIPGYGGGDEMWAGMLRGDVESHWYTIESTLPRSQVPDGEVRPILTLNEEPADFHVEAGYGDIPTIADLGHEEFTNFGLTRLLGGPPGIDDQLADIWEQALLDALEDPDFLEWTEEVDYALHPGGREDARQAVESGVEVVENNRDLIEEFG